MGVTAGDVHCRGTRLRAHLCQPSFPYLRHRSPPACRSGSSCLVTSDKIKTAVGRMSSLCPEHNVLLHTARGSGSCPAPLAGARPASSLESAAGCSAEQGTCQPASPRYGCSSPLPAATGKVMGGKGRSGARLCTPCSHPPQGGGGGEGLRGWRARAAASGRAGLAPLTQSHPCVRPTGGS